MLVRRGARNARTAWAPAVEQALTDAQLARNDLVAVADRPVQDVEWAGLQRKATASADVLDRVAGASPTDQGRRAAAAVAQSLRSLLQAVEDERLASLSPEGSTELRNLVLQRQHELDLAIARLTELVPEPGGASAPS